MKRRFEMKVTGAAGIQCAILLMGLLAEIIFAGRHHVISDPMEQDAGVGEERVYDIQEKGASGLQEESVSDIQEKSASDMQEESVSDMSEESIPGMQDQEDIALQNRDYAEALERLKGKAEVVCDLNFDGYPDIEIYDSEKRERGYYLWDEAESQFVRAVIPAEEVKGISIEKQLDEFKTFWGYGDVRDEEYRLLKSTEKLYRWDDIVLKEVRSISSRFEGEEVVITLTDAESGECFGGGTFEEKGWETNPGVRELYERFYQGYAPKELYYMRHDAPGEEQVIPESLVEELRWAYEKGTGAELLVSLETGRELSDSEKEKAAAESADIARVMEDMDNERVKMIRVDLDNDGVEDIFAELDFGGTGAFGEYVLYQGNEAGAYRRTGLGTEEHVRKPFYVICFEGKNYVCHHRTVSGRWHGLILECYRDGGLVETVSLYKVPGKQTDSVTFCRDGYQDMAQKELGKAPEIYERTVRDTISEGDAEQRDKSGDAAIKNTFFSDIDNDGAVEKYAKRITGYPADFFWLATEDEEGNTRVEPEIPACSDEAGVESMMWVDACGGKNIMNVMYRIGWYDYVVEGFLLNDKGDCSNLYTVERRSELEVETVRTWELPGKHHFSGTSYEIFSF